MPNNKKRSHSRTFQLHKDNNKKVPKKKMSFKEAEDRGHKIKSSDYLQQLQRHFESVVRQARGYIQCGKHDFQTDDWDAWNEHMDKEPHTMMGTIMCKHCNKPIKFDNLPIILGFKRRLQCKKCKKYTTTMMRKPTWGPTNIEII